MFDQTCREGFLIRRWGYSIFSSMGSLDITCAASRLSLGILKDMICVPVTLALRNDLKTDMDVAWHELTAKDVEAAASNQRNLSTDSDEVSLGQSHICDSVYICMLCGSMLLLLMGGVDERHLTLSLLLCADWFHPGHDFVPTISTLAGKHDV